MTYETDEQLIRHYKQKLAAVTIERDNWESCWKECVSEYATVTADRNRLREALIGLEASATSLSNHDKIKQPTRSQSDWSKLHHRIDVARRAIEASKEATT